MGCSKRNARGTRVKRMGSGMRPSPSWFGTLPRIYVRKPVLLSSEKQINLGREVSLEDYQTRESAAPFVRCAQLAAEAVPIMG